MSAPDSNGEEAGSAPNAPVPVRRLLAHPGHCIALGFGLGMSPWAPGTLGSLLAFPLYWTIQPLDLGYRLAVIVLLFVAGCWLCGRTATCLGRPDPAAVVWDEAVGLLLVLNLAPPAWPWWLTAFVAFRLFDVTKPWPIGWADRRVSGGVGIMLDDALAGVYTIGTLEALQFLTGTRGGP